MSQATTIQKVPSPRCSMTVRPAIAPDVPFIDHLQKMHSHMVGWMPGKQLEGKISAGHVLIGEDEKKTPVGYVISQDQYMGRDDVGVIYQLNVAPLQQRNLIGATLIKSVFERAAYGCRLFCLWCAQDIQANFFWESIGFIPLAFRTGARHKQRTHIFWQRRVRSDDTVTPYWYPYQTKNGAIREDRLVIPIPVGVHWRDPMPMLLPEVQQPKAPPIPKTLPGGAPVRPRPEQPKMTQSHRMAIVRSQSKHLGGLPPGKAAILTSGGIKYIERGDYVPEPQAPKPKRAPRPVAKHDPAQIAAARELRDRFLEQVNSGRLIGGVGGAQGKYEVARLPASSTDTASGTTSRPPRLAA